MLMPKRHRSPPTNLDADAKEAPPIRTLGRVTRGEKGDLLPPVPSEPEATGIVCESPAFEESFWRH